MEPAMSSVDPCPGLLPRVWIYTNFDCNLTCRYCVARSGPRVERRGLSLATFKRLVDEAAAHGIRELFITGGEPFLLPDIGEKLRHAAERLPTTVLTNAMLFQGRRLETVRGLVGLDLRFQVSLDGPDAATHDAYRGANSWQRTIEGIRTLQQLGARVTLSTTETPTNHDRLEELRAFVAALGIAQDEHFIRPLARRGYSAEGIEVSAADLEPEVTVSVDGVYWHPLACEEDLLVSRRVFPFSEAMATVHEQYHSVLASGARPVKFR